MRQRHRGFYAHLLCGAAAISLATAAGAARAEDQPRFDIPPQSLASALASFGVQSRHTVIASPALTGAKTTRGVAGAADPEAALRRMLDGTGLTFRRDGGTFLIVRAAEASVRPVRVTAAEAVGAGTAAAEAPGAGAAPETNVVQELVVTAQKKSENIQVVPIAISAFTQQDLTTRQVAGGPDLMTQVPNMTFTKTNFSSYSIQIRGIGTQAISATTDAAVAVAFNNTPFIQNRFFEQEFYDLERVEVLRGPQGTLYGRNATAGVVNIISAKPSFNFEAKASGDVANYSSKRLEGMVNIPLVEDKVALRVAGAWTKRDGYDTNQITGNQIDGRDIWSTRTSLRFEPNDKIHANLIWEHFQENDDRLRSGKQLCKKNVISQVGGIPVEFEQTLPNAGVSGAPFAGVQATFSQGCERNSLYAPDSFQTPNGAMLPYYLPLGGLGLGVKFFDPYASQTQSRDLRVIEATVDPKYTSKSDLGELQVSWNLTDSLTLSSETAYSADFVWSKQDFNRFNTKPGAWLLNLGQAGAGILSPDLVFTDPQIGPSDRLVAVDLSTAKGTQFSQEFRLSSDFGGPFNFSLGANFLRYDTVAKYYVFINSLSLVSAAIDSSFTPLGGDPVPYIPGVSENRECGLADIPGDPTTSASYTCIFTEQNSIENIQDQGHNYFLSKNPYRLISYAVFGEAYYNITDNLKLTGGLRWTVDEKHAPRIPSWALAGTQGPIGTRGYPVMEVIDQEWREPTGRLAIDWKPDLAFTDQTLLYASYAHGYKAGGANPPPMVEVGYSSTGLGRASNSATRPKTFDPEFVDAFELGSKNTFADGKATLNLAAFYYDYKGYQVSEIVDRSAFNRNFDATVWGLEVEADWRPLKNLRLGFKGGYEDTRIADGEHAIDLMDRTAGNTDWVVVRPFPTFASSCILPVALFTHVGKLGPLQISEDTVQTGGLRPVGLGGVGGGNPGGCELAYLGGFDPVTTLPYVPYPTVFAGASTGGTWPVGTYPGWNPLDESIDHHNHGEGFFKELGGNQLPNAPHFTGTITVDYTLPLPRNWLVTLHTDLYAQSNSWWRVFNDHAYDKLHPYFTMNLAAIFSNEDAGWKVMAYVKNVFDRDSITGAFLNSDDTGLTTNVFLTEPRLFGVRVTKDFTGGPLLGAFGARHEGPYPFTIEIGGQIQRHDAPNDPVTPSFIDQFSDTLNPLADQQHDLDWGDGRDVKLTWRPDSAWAISLGARFGRTNGETPWAVRSEVGDSACRYSPEYCAAHPGLILYRINYSTSDIRAHEEHTLVDFAVGKEVGIGLLGDDSSSTVSAGLRLADLSSRTAVRLFGITNWDIPADDYSKYDFTSYSTHNYFDASLVADRKFKGAGPVLSWEASKGLLGGKDAGVVSVDWSVSGGVLFGKRQTSITGKEIEEDFSVGTYTLQVDPIYRAPFRTVTTPISIHRSESATVPTFGAGLGLSYKIDRIGIGAGYRWERYFNAIDGGGYGHSKSEDRTIDGPYLKVSIGFGG